ncbi:MAG: hypothetical protein AAGF12_35995 [Myxococcota bacterium]
MQSPDPSPSSGSFANPPRSTEKRGCRPWLVWLAGGVLVLVGIVCIGGALAINPIAASQVEARIEEYGAECDPLDISVSLTDGTAELAPTVCRFTDGPILSIRTSRPATIRLEGLRPVEIETTEVEIALKPRTPPATQAGWLGQLATLAGAQNTMNSLLMDVAELSKKEAPNVAIQTLRVRRGGSHVVTISGLRIAAAPQRWDATADGIDFVLDPNADVEELTATITPNEAQATGDIRAGINFGVFEMSSRVRATVIGRNLERGPPEFSVRIP